MNKITKTLLGAAMVLSLGAMMLFPVPASAAEETDGTEMQVMQAEKLEIQLGADWAGVEFELKTDSGTYPGTIPVGEDGVLRLEIGGSSSYVLTCMNSEVSAPDQTQAPATTEEPQEEDSEPSEQQDDEESVKNIGEDTESPAEKEANTVAGIPVAHLALFGGGMVLAVGSLIGMYIIRRRRCPDTDYEEDDED